MTRTQLRAKRRFDRLYAEQSTVILNQLWTRPGRRFSKNATRRLNELQRKLDQADRLI